MKMGTAAVEREEAEDLETTLEELVSMGRLLKVYDPETGEDRYAPADEKWITLTRTESGSRSTGTPRREPH
jgi:hypothetical protein